MTVKSLRKQLAAAIAMTLVATVALGSSTYAWFVSNTKVTASQVNVTASTAYALQISLDDDTNVDSFGTSCVLIAGKANGRTVYKNAAGTAVVYVANDGKQYADANTTTENASTISAEDLADTTKWTKVAGANLKPVSTIGGAAAEPVFYADTSWAQDTSTGHTGSAASAFTTTAAAGGFYVTSFKIKASQVCDLRLDSENTSFDVATGANKAMLEACRFALVVTGSDNAKKSFIYQIDAGSTSGTAYNTTLSTLTGADVDTGSLGTGALGIKYAISGTANVGEIAAANITAGGTGVPVYTTTGIMTTTSDSALAPKAESALEKANVLYHFASANDQCTVTFYIWMEGCDAQCNATNINNFNNVANAIVAKLGFCAAESAD